MRFFLSTLFILFLSFFFVYPRRPIILIDPAGHAKDLGRLLVEGYERAQTLKFAQAIAKALLKKQKVRPVISRKAGEALSHELQIPSFANRLQTDFFLRICIYRETSEKPKLFLYHLLYNPLVDLAERDATKLSFVSLHQAHFGAIHQTRFFGTKMCDYLNQESFRKYFDCYPLRGLPLRSLVGITAPALLLEIGICRENKWESLVEPVVDSLNFLSTLG